MEKKMDIFFRSIADIKRFVSFAGGMEGNVTLSAGRYVIDGKSLMGIFTLDLSQPLRLEVEKWKEEYEKILEPYLLC